MSEREKSLKLYQQQTNEHQAGKLGWGVIFEGKIMKKKKKSLDISR